MSTEAEALSSGASQSVGAVLGAGHTIHQCPTTTCESSPAVASLLVSPICRFQCGFVMVLSRGTPCACVGMVVVHLTDHKLVYALLVLQHKIGWAQVGIILFSLLSIFLDLGTSKLHLYEPANVEKAIHGGSKGGAGCQHLVLPFLMCSSVFN